MSFLKNNHSEVKEGGFGPLPAGEYEVFPTEYAIETSRSGKLMVQFNYTVRDDVDQEGGGRQFKYDNFVEDPNSVWRFLAASKAAGLEDGKEYATAKEWAEDFKNKPVRVYVEQEEAQNGKVYNVVKNFKSSEVGGQAAPSSQAGNSGPAAANHEPIDISDDDLPF